VEGEEIYRQVNEASGDIPIIIIGAKSKKWNRGSKAEDIAVNYIVVLVHALVPPSIPPSFLTKLSGILSLLFPSIFIVKFQIPIKLSSMVSLPAKGA